MPITSAAQFGAMLSAARGKGKSKIPKRVAKEFLRKTSESQRRAFGKALARKRRGGS